MEGRKQSIVQTPTTPTTPRSAISPSFRPGLPNLITSLPLSSNHVRKLSDALMSMSPGQEGAAAGIVAALSAAETASMMEIEESNSATKRRNSGVNLATPVSRMEKKHITGALSVRTRGLITTKLHDDSGMSPVKVSSNTQGPSGSLRRKSLRSSTTATAAAAAHQTLASSPTPIRSSIRKRRVQTLSPPPSYHMTLKPSSNSTSAYTQAITHLATPLVPLISVSTGQPHDKFPRSLLQYHLLTHEELDELARWYHQVIPPVRESGNYPCPVPGWVGMEAGEGGDRSGAGNGDRDVEGNVTGNKRRRRVSLRTKRRRWGRFMGLRGCDTPAVKRRRRSGAAFGGGEDGVDDEDDENGDAEGEGDVERRMEREWKRAMERRAEEERLVEKSWRGRW